MDSKNEKIFPQSLELEEGEERGEGESSTNLAQRQRTIASGMRRRSCHDGRSGAEEVYWSYQWW